MGEVDARDKRTCTKDSLEVEWEVVCNYKEDEAMAEAKRKTRNARPLSK